MFGRGVFLLPFMLLISQTPSHAADVKGQGFETKAEQVYVVEGSTGTVLLAKNEQKGFSPASLTKLLTADLVFDALKTNQVSPETEYPVSENAWRTGGAPSRTATMFAALKSRVPVGDLVRGMVIQGANDACIVLAEGMSGGERSFADAMMRRARTRGMTGSYFTNSTGLPDGGKSRTTARDMVTLAMALKSDYPDWFKLYAQPDFQWNKILQRNRNPLLGLDLDADGLATGFAEGEGFSIVASAERDGKRIFMALSGLPSDKERTEEAKRVLGWALGSFETRQLFAQGEPVGEAGVYGGAAHSVALVADGPVSVYIPINNPDRLSARIVYRWPISAPVAAHHQAGTLLVQAGDRVLREIPLFTANAVAEGTLADKALDAMLELGETLFFSWLWEMRGQG